jgi:hypothetical protein
MPQPPQPPCPLTSSSPVASHTMSVASAIVREKKALRASVKAVLKALPVEDIQAQCPSLYARRTGRCAHARRTRSHSAFDHREPVRVERVQARTDDGVLHVYALW